MSFRFGNIPDEFDARDIPLYSTGTVRSLLTSSSQSTAKASTQVVLPDLPPIYNQGDIGSCVGNAVAAALRYAHRKNAGIAYADFKPSRLFIYYNARGYGDPAKMNDKLRPPNVQKRALKDSGTTNRAAIHSLLVQGVCTESTWPYGNPSSNEETDAFNNLDAKPNPVEPADWGNVISEA